MWTALVVAVRLPFFVLGLVLLFGILGTLTAVGTVIVLAFAAVAFPFEVLGAIFKNRPDLIGLYITHLQRDIRIMWWYFGENLNALVKWGSGD